MRHRLPEAPAGRYPSPWLRLLILLTALLGLNYIIWRWLASLNWSAWWIAAVVLITKSCDIGAYFTGMSIGRRLRQVKPSDES